MHVRGITIVEFMSHEDTTVVLPKAGVVLITGPNGAGKSTLFEAVSVGLWGKTLRGTDPWNAGASGRASVTTDKLQINRSYNGRSKSLGWEFLDASVEGTTYESTSKAQEALEAVIGSHEVWRRTHCFSSSDASHFTMATDGERKRLLEAILGLDRFDPALEAARSDRKKLEDTLAALELRHQAAKSIVGESAKNLARLETEAATFKPVDAPTGKLTELERMMERTAREIRAMQKAVHEAELAGADRKAALRSIEDRAARLARSACPSCGQSIPAALRDDLTGQVAELKSEIESVRARALESVAGMVDQEAELTEELQALQTKRQALASRVAQAEVVNRHYASLARMMTSAREDHAKAVNVLAEVQQLMPAVVTAKAECAAAETVLGLKGVRAHVLGKALSGIEIASNAWLSRVAGTGIALHLKPFSEKKSGGFTDAIALEIEGAGGGNGYHGASGGERRRIDVALLLALAEVSRASHGGDASTLFFDEVFDALDDDGAEAVAEVLTELAQDRVVVVISHNPRIRACVHLNVTDGKMRVS